MHRFWGRLAPGNVTIHSVFGSDGRRISEYRAAKKGRSGGTSRAMREGTGALIRHYVWMGDLPVAVIEGGQVFFVRTDHTGRPVFATTSAGTQVWSASYLPFGGVHVAAGAPVDLRFPGQWFQAETGLHQNWMRDYDPTTGRYLEPDPLGLDAGISLYGYALQNPGRWIDPTGENPVAIASAACRLAPGACAAAGRAVARVCIEGAKIAVGAVVGLFSSADEGCGCEDDCARATAEAQSAYDRLSTRITEYQWAKHHGRADPGHLKAIRQRQVPLQNALKKVEKSCPVPPAEFAKWLRAAHQPTF